MTAVVRTWLGFAALGAGLVHLALAVDAPVGLATALALFGIAEFAWGVIAFTTARPPLPSVARAIALVPVVAWALALVSGLAFVGAVRVFPMLVASVLDLAIAIGITALLRRPPGDRPLRPAVTLVAMFAGALVIGAVTTPALAATQAGDVAVPHGDYGDLGDSGHPGH